MKQKIDRNLNLILALIVVVGKVQSNERISDFDDEKQSLNATKYSTKYPEIFEFDDAIQYSYDLKRLRDSLMYGYDKFSRPRVNSAKPVVVKIGVNVAQINGLDEDFQIMVSTLQISFRWNDEYLRWNKSLYANSILFRSFEIWTPDIIAINSMNAMVMVKESLLAGGSISILDPNEKTKYLITVKPNGDCRWVFPMKLMSNCQLDQMYFPFDTQKCNIDFGSTAYSDDQIQLRPFQKNVHLELQQKTEFDLLAAKYIYAKLDGMTSGYVDHPSIMMRTQVILKRKMTYYLNKIILPYFTFYVVTAFTYLLPVESSEKKSYCTSILISGFIYLKDTSSYIPKSMSMPMITIYFDCNLIFVFICVISSTIVYNIYFMGKTKKPLPNLLKKLIKQTWLTKWINFGSGNLLHESNSIDLKSKLEINSELMTDVNTKITNEREKNNHSQIKNIIQQELNEVNNQLTLIKENFNIKEDIFKEIQTNPVKAEEPVKVKKDAMNPHQIDIIGHSMLKLLKAINTVIKEKNSIPSEIDTYDTVSDWLLFVFGINRKPWTEPEECDPTSNNDHIYINILRKKLRYINTLENLKSDLIKPETKSKTKPKTVDEIKPNLSSYSAAKEVDSVRVATKYLTLLKLYKNQIRQYMGQASDAEEPPAKKMTIKVEKVQLEPDYSRDWKLLAILIDRLIFSFFAIVIPLCLFTMYMKVLLLKNAELD